MILKDWKLLSLRRPIKTMLVTSAIIGASAASAQMMQEYPYSTFKGFQEINHSSTDDTVYLHNIWDKLGKSKLTVEHITMV